jgi:hypothetical protein
LLSRSAAARRISRPVHRDAGKRHNVAIARRMRVI